MDYISTRGAGRADGLQAVLTGLAPDGGLYVDPAPERRAFDWRGCIGQEPLEIAARVTGHLLPDYEDMGGLVRRAYRDKFDTPELTPLVKVGDAWVLELFHGPTCAFKDLALSVLPQLMAQARAASGEERRIQILTATSGDTGKAALEGFRGAEGIDICVFYPEGGVSPVQRAQMVTQEGDNVRVCALRGNFDDCQRGVKEAFSLLKDEPGVLLSSANSINIGRLAPQAAYYFTAYGELVRQGEIQPGEPVDFSVPTGNFGDILAGYLAALMGLPVGRLICASNANRVLTDFIRTGVYDRRREFVRTVSPSMDILVSSNLERLLYYASGGDCGLVRRCMESLNRDGVYTLSGAPMEHIRDRFAAYWQSEEDTLRTIASLWEEQGYLCDTHTAVAYGAAREYMRAGGNKTVVLSTASPYKFPGAVLSALGQTPAGDEFDQTEQLRQLCGLPVPAGLRGLRDRPVLHRDVIDRDELAGYVRSHLRRQVEA